MKRIVFLFLALALILSAVSAALAVEYPAEGISNAKDVKIRAKAGPSGKQIGTLKKGETIRITGETTLKNGDLWYQVETAKGKTGYVLADYLSVPEIDLIEGAKEADGATAVTVSVKATCADYNGVGKNWTHYYEWNGVQAQDGKADGFVAPGVDLTVYARIREQDSKPDTGTEKTTYTPTEEDVANGFTVTQKVKVTENSGKNAGKSAVWTVTFSFSPSR